MRVLRTEARRFQENGPPGLLPLLRDVRAAPARTVAPAAWRTQHLGKVYLPPDPSRTQQQERLAGPFKRKLDRAVSNEDFERAAKLRDMIRELEAAL